MIREAETGGVRRRIPPSRMGSSPIARQQPNGWNVQADAQRASVFGTGANS